METWKSLVKTLLPSTTFEEHLAQYNELGDPLLPIWYPDPPTESNLSNIQKSMRKRSFKSYTEFYDWSNRYRDAFWKFAISELKIKFKHLVVRPIRIGNEWLTRSTFNIVESCFQHPSESVAIIYDDQRMTYGELECHVNRFANGLLKRYPSGTRVGICMPMNVESVISYLGIVKAGCTVVSIADSFPKEQIEKRLRIANAKVCVVQDSYERNGKTVHILPRFDDIDIDLIVLSSDPSNSSTSLSRTATSRSQSRTVFSYDQFLDSQTLCPYQYGANEINILFSSGTTGDPKAIPWTHATPIKCASDAYFHHDVKVNDVFVWPTNLGWMMGPFLIFATLINGATMGLSKHSPTTLAFLRFLDVATHVGVVPSLVKAWRTHSPTIELSQNIRCFSSTGETSNIEDMHWLSSRVQGYRPVIEYCGGTEIGGGYITSTMELPNVPGHFNTPALGNGIASSGGDVADIMLTTPSIGLSTHLLNRDHHETYYAGMPEGHRKHGDHIQRIETETGILYRSCGRTDDTMNLGGIKTSALEIENACRIASVSDACAVTINPQGVEQLIVCVITRDNVDAYDLCKLEHDLKHAIKTKLNPLFKIHKVCRIQSVPRTASNKVLRRKLREQVVEYLTRPSLAQVVSMARTPFGDYRKSLSSYSATDLGGIAIKAVLDRSPNKVSVDSCIMGNVLSSNLGQAPCKNAAQKAGLSPHVPCTTVNRVCSSGMTSVIMAAQQIQLKESSYVIAGGMESMTNVPFYQTEGKPVNGMVFDGLTDTKSNKTMGFVSDDAAIRHSITRNAVDAFAIQSFQRALAKQQDTMNELIPMDELQQDEHIHRIDAQKMKMLFPCFQPNGVTTPGNSSALSDGACAMMLAPPGSGGIFDIIGYQEVSTDPELFTDAPAIAIQRLLIKCNLTIEEIDIFEINEAFGTAVLANMKLLGINDHKVNVYGGAIAIGHPLGASGTRIIMSAYDALCHTQGRFACAAICNGGGGATAMLIRRLPNMY